MTRARLESLSFEELKRLAEKEKVVVPEDIEKDALIDLIQEILDELMQERLENNNPSVKVEELKYHISQDEELELQDGDEYQIPLTYNKTRIVLVPRDPYWAFAYWEIEKKNAEELEADPDFGGYFLRVHDVKLVEYNGTNSNYFFDIPVQENDTSWYINVPHANSAYLLELFYLYNGEVHLMARSNIIRTSRDTVAEEGLLIPGVETERLLELTAQQLLSLPSSWGAIPQRIISFVNLKYLRQSD